MGFCLGVVAGIVATLVAMRILVCVLDWCFSVLVCMWSEK